MKYYLAYRLTFEREQLRRDVLARLSVDDDGRAPLQGIPDSETRR
jgi:hypothetical protein